MTSPTPMMQNPLQNSAYLRSTQYRTSDNLSRRADFHARFSRGPHEWNSWVFEQLNLGPNECALECGAGPAWLWRSDSGPLPIGCRIILTDLSTGMIDEARATLGDRPAFSFGATDVQNLPFPDRTFSLAVANHMLYHVSDLGNALGELSRVLTDDGRLIAATNGRDHLKELYDIGESLLPDVATTTDAFRNPHADPGFLFRIETGEALLRPYFGSVSYEPFESWLEVTAAAPLVDYLFSLPCVQELGMSMRQRETAIARLEAQLETAGSVRITKQTGLFIAREPRRGA